MDFIGTELLNELGREATYTAPDGVPVPVKVILRDRGTKSRVGRGIVLTSDVVAAVSDALPWQRNGVIEMESTRYRIDDKQPGAPGLLELGMTRIDGAMHESRETGLQDAVISEFGRLILINGEPVIAHVVRTGVHRKMNDRGMIVETIKTNATFKVEDFPDFRPTDSVSIDGRIHKIQSYDRNGFGLITVVLD